MERLEFVKLCEKGKMNPFEKMICTCESLKEVGVELNCIMSYIKSFQKAHPNEEYAPFMAAYLTDLSREYNVSKLSLKKLNDSI